MVQEEEESSKEPSKAAQKRVKKKAAAKQAAAAAAATPAASATDISKQQPHQNSTPADTQGHATEAATTAAINDLQQLSLDAPGAGAVSSATAAAAGQQSLDDWMMCPLSEV